MSKTVTRSKGNSKKSHIKYLGDCAKNYIGGRNYGTKLSHSKQIERIV